MFRRELKVNLKSFIIWTLVLVFLFILVFVLYSTIIGTEKIDNINELIKVFPEDVLRMFNLDITHIDTAFGWMETEGVIFALLITGVYSSIIGCNILLKEENDKTIEYLSSLPVKRSQIVLNKALCGLLYVVIMIILFGISNYICLGILEKFDKKVFIYLSLAPIFSNIVIFSFSLFISTFVHKTKQILSFGLGFVFISYFLSIVSEMSDKVKFLRYFSVYTLADTRGIIKDERISLIYVGLALLLTIVFIVLSLIRYNKKELV